MNYIEEFRTKYPEAYRAFVAWYLEKLKKEWITRAYTPALPSFIMLPSPFQLGVLLSFNKEIITEEQQANILNNLSERDIPLHFDIIIEETWKFIESIQ